MKHVQTGATTVLLTLHIHAARTPLGTQLDAKILQPFFYQHLRTRSMQKPILVITITDGGELVRFCDMMSCWSGPRNLISLACFCA
jgi:hypothetical protein